MIPQAQGRIKPPPTNSGQDATPCTCGHCRRYWLAKPDGELAVYDNEDGLEVRTWLPAGVTVRRLAPGEQAQNIQVSGSNGATVRFADGQIHVADVWNELPVWLPDDVALVFDESAVRQAESEADRG